MAHNFLNLSIWQRSMDLADLVFEFNRSMPETERYNLINQMNRCCCSIPSNIAEGSGKRTNKHFAEFLSTALSSSYELYTQLLICKRRNYGQPAVLEKCLKETTEIQRMIFVFRETLN
jgi:four helix bundle protein